MRSKIRTIRNRKILEGSAQSTKESAAKSGIASGALLAAIELIGGILTGSLGLLSSALNTVMDLTAAIIAFFAVREGGKEPDESHPYGHEKIEAFAAIGEIVLLFVVCVWLVYMAVGRLASGTASIGIFWLALCTNFASIAVDLYAYRRFRSTTKRHGSEALGAGALHFLNDLLIAIVVIFGLVVYNFGIWYADSVAALGVVAIILFSSLDVVKSSVNILMDTAPSGAVRMLRERILSLEGVEGCHSLRVRRSGSKHFVDAHIEVEGDLPLSRAHAIAESIETEINGLFPGSDVLIHTEPYSSGDPIARIRQLSSEFPEIRGVHEVSVNNIGENIFISNHVEMDAAISLEQAHEVAHRLEESMKQAFGRTTTIVSHLEPTIELSSPTSLSQRELSDLKRMIIKAAEGTSEIASAHEIQSLIMGEKLCVTLHCTVDGSISLDQAHDISTRLEEKIKSIDRRIGHVIVHCEPEETPPHR